jgi:hypothetical protein
MAERPAHSDDHLRSQDSIVFGVRPRDAAASLDFIHSLRAMHIHDNIQQILMGW